MKILITYGTYSGSTQLVAELISHKLQKLGHESTVTDMNTMKLESFDGYDAYILGTNTWFENKEEGMMHGAYIEFSKSVGEATPFSGKKFSIFALGDASQYLQFCKSADHLDAMVKKFGGAVVTAPLKLDQYYLDTHTKEEEIDEWLGRSLRAFIAS